MARDDGGFFAVLSANNMRLRIASSLALIAVAFAVFSAGYWAVGLLFVLMFAIMLWEYDAMLAGGKFSPKFFFDLVFIGVPLASYCIFAFAARAQWPPAYAPACFFAFWFCTSMLGYIAAGRTHWIFEALPPLYIGLPMLSAAYIYATAGGSALAYIFVITVSTDTGAFLIGSLVKGPKLAPSISPKKTWSGALGGMFCAFVFGTAFQVLLLWREGADMGGVYFWALASALLSVLAQAGDLFESKVKRITGVKDSSNFIPGHGGLLDRFDSFLFVAPAVALLLALSRLGAMAP
jgi:phosphatidate cytidylyltransferase